ncbi:hypothetical protein JXB27_03070 [Candidatus Woesearchaeota archaeon]|nr:hypothetical protein [Candidatus Woesearchaeota archaeon]
MGVFTSSLKKSIGKTISKYRYLPGIAGLDLLFLLLFGVISFFFSLFAENHFVNVAESGGRLIPEITEALAEGKLPLSAFLSDQVVMSNLMSVASYAIIFAVFAYVIYILMQGSAWFITYKIANEKKKFKEFMPRFSLLSARWTGIVAVYLFLAVLFVGIFLLRPEPSISSVLFSLVTEIINYVLLCIAFLSFAMLYSKKPIINSLKFIFKHPVRIISALFIIALAFYVNFGITFWIFNNLSFSATATGAYIAAFIRFLIAAPFLAWARVFLIEIAKSK